MKKAKVMNLAMLVLLLTLFSFVSTIEAKTSEQKQGGVLRIVYGDAINCIGYPGGIASFQEHQVAEPAVETLGRYDETGVLVPYLARDFKLDADSLTLTIYLRDGVKFHDGTICDAEAVKWNLEEFKASGRNEIDDVTSIEVVDPLTLVLHLSKWNNSIADAVLFTVHLYNYC